MFNKHHRFWLNEFDVIAILSRSSFSVKFNVWHKQVDDNQNTWIVVRHHKTPLYGTKCGILQHAKCTICASLSLIDQIWEFQVYMQTEYKLF